MLRRFVRQPWFCLLVMLAVVGGYAQPAWAHNSFVSSNPADGASVGTPPTKLSLVFGAAVPLDTVSVDLLDAASVKTALSGLTHGPAGATEVLAPLPRLTAGSYTFRWRLVGADGHAVSGRVAVTITATASSTPMPTATLKPTVAPATVTTIVPGVPSTVRSAVTPVAAPTTAPSASTVPETIGSGVSMPPSSVAALPSTSVASATSVAQDSAWALPGLFRWALRLGSYLAMMLIIGVIAVAIWVWPAAADDDMLRRLVARAYVLVVGSAIMQLLVVASDIAGRPPWAAIGSLGGALHTDAGKAFAFRSVIVSVMALVLFVGVGIDDRLRLPIAAALSVLAMATWAFAGHSSSMRWPIMGVPLDIAHFAAASAWLVTLGTVALLAFRSTMGDEREGVVQRVGQVAATCVSILIVTGVVQSFRLVGAPWRVFAVTHGRLLLLKVLLVGLMLKVGDVNRSRVMRRRQVPATKQAPGPIEGLRRAMLTEVGIGLAVMAVTAAMVVSPPATAQAETKAPTKTSTTAVSTTTSAPNAVAVVVATTATTAVPVSTTAVLAACRIAKGLTLGDTGEPVLCLQRALATRGLLAAAPSGSFDGPTAAAVRAFQAANNLLVDGLVGRVTATALGIWAP